MVSYNKKYRRVSIKSRLRALIFKFIFLFLICAAFTGFIYLSKFRLKNIVLENDSNLKSQVEKIATDKLSEKKIFILPRDNFFIFSKKWLSREIMSVLPKIKNIYFDREFPDTLIIKFEEKKEAALWCGPEENNTEEKCYLLDEDGAVMQKDIYFSNDIWNSIPKFKDVRTLFGNRTSEFGNRTPEFVKFLDNVKNNFQIKTKEILVYNSKYEIYFDEGWFAVLDDKTNFDLAYDNLKLIFNSKMKTREERKNLEYIDLRLINKIFLKRR